MADIAIVRKIPWHTLLLTGLLLFTRRIDRSRYVSIYRAPELIITRKKGKYVNIDGEPVKMPRQIHVKVHPASLNILIPSRFTTHV